MGARLVAEATVFALPKLGRHHAARVAFLVMCNTAMDKDPTPKYFAGIDPIATALGITATGKAREIAVSKALKPLKEMGLITRETDHKSRKVARWILNTNSGMSRMRPVEKPGDRPKDG